MTKKKKYSKVSITTKDFPQELIDAFVYCHNEDWSEESYIEYSEQAKLYLGNKYEDKIERGILTVQLTSVTFDLVNKRSIK